MHTATAATQERTLSLQGDLLTLKMPGRKKGTVDVFRYRLHRIETRLAGHAFRFLRIETPRPDDDGDGVYDVFLPTSHSEAPVCHCRGFLRWHHCKHVDACRALVARGLI
jgi:hypothetical protein